jgi:hypothetical protein
MDNAANQLYSRAKEFRLTGQGKSKRIDFEGKTIQRGVSTVTFLDVRIGSQHLTGEMVMDYLGGTLFLQMKNGQKRVTSAMISPLEKTGEGTISVWLGDSPSPEILRVNFQKLEKTKSLAESVNGIPQSVARLLEEGAKEQKVVLDEVAPLLTESMDHNWLADWVSPYPQNPCEGFDPDSGWENAPPGCHPQSIRWWCIAIYCVPGAGLFGLAIPACRR